MVNKKLKVNKTKLNIMSSGRGNCLGFAPSSQNRALCALHKPARSVRYPDSLRSIRTQIRFWWQKLHKTATRLVVHIFTKLNSSLRNSHWAKPNVQTNLALTMFR